MQNTQQLASMITDRYVHISANTDASTRDYHTRTCFDNIAEPLVQINVSTNGRIIAVSCRCLGNNYIVLFLYKHCSDNAVKMRKVSI